MDAERFDRWTRRLAAGISRRGTMRALTAAVLGAALGGALARSPEAVRASHCPPNTTECGSPRPLDLAAPCCPAGTNCCTNAEGYGQCCYPTITWCDDGHCGCLWPGYTCCEGAYGGRAACSPDRTCCSLDIGAVACCASGLVCDPTAQFPATFCVANCPTGRVQCGTVCCRTGEVCAPSTRTCVRIDPRLPASTSGSGGPQLVTPLCRLGQTDCGGTCVDLNSSDQHCGQCGRGCDYLHETCVNGHCCPVTRECVSTCCPPCFICDPIDKACRPCDPQCEFCGDPHSQCLLKAPINNQGVGAPCSLCSTCYKGKCRNNIQINYLANKHIVPPCVS